MVNKIIGFVLLGIFVIFFFTGLYYLCHDYEAVRVYVGGDAYNYIISAGRETARSGKATACFVVAFGSLISSILLGTFKRFEANKARD